MRRRRISPAGSSGMPLVKFACETLTHSRHNEGHSSQKPHLDRETRSCHRCARGLMSQQTLIGQYGNHKNLLLTMICCALVGFGTVLPACRSDSQTPKADPLTLAYRLAGLCAPMRSCALARVMSGSFSLVGAQHCFKVRVCVGQRPIDLPADRLKSLPAHLWQHQAGLSLPQVHMTRQIGLPAVFGPRSMWGLAALLTWPHPHISANCFPDPFFVVDFCGWIFT